jgi:hypothetical protein
VLFRSVQFLEYSNQKGRPLLVISESVDGDALNTMVLNKLRGTIKAAAVRAPGFGELRKENLDDIEDELPEDETEEMPEETEEMPEETDEMPADEEGAEPMPEEGAEEGMEKTLAEALKRIKEAKKGLGNRKVLDKNKNGILDKEDFELLREGKKEESVEMPMNEGLKGKPISAWIKDFMDSKNPKFKGKSKKKDYKNLDLLLECCELLKVKDVKFTKNEFIYISS